VEELRFLRSPHLLHPHGHTSTSLKNLVIPPDEIKTETWPPWGEEASGSEGLTNKFIVVMLTNWRKSSVDYRNFSHMKFNLSSLWLISSLSSGSAYHSQILSVVRWWKDSFFIFPSRRGGGIQSLSSEITNGMIRERRQAALAALKSPVNFSLSGSSVVVFGKRTGWVKNERCGEWSPSPRWRSNSCLWERKEKESFRISLFDFLFIGGSHQGRRRQEDMTWHDELISPSVSGGNEGKQGGRVV